MTGPSAAPEPFVGEVRGVRRFRVRGPDALAPIFGRPTPFLPGTNVADCRSLVGLMLHHRDGQTSPAEKCWCGFYAYYHDDCDLYQYRTGTMQGVVEAWGTVTTGNNGFRAENMRLVALVRRSPHPLRIREVNGVILPGDGISLAAVVGATLGFWISMVLPAQINPVASWGAVVIPLMMLLFGVGGHLVSHLTSHGMVERTRRVDEALADRYGVPLFDTLHDAMTAYPVTGRPDTP